jgi:hypothetical protein
MAMAVDILANVGKLDQEIELANSKWQRDRLIDREIARNRRYEPHIPMYRCYWDHQQQTELEVMLMYLEERVEDVTRFYRPQG